ncbi:MAG TPA: hypothetical protein VMG80_02765 [Solirubrobacteraceae bacterium]|nr:hypothetical protein [Solirubrobacteraceae bacterium]
MLVAIVTVLLLGIAILVISAPLRATRSAPEPDGDDELAALGIAREVKYREIRDAELDYRTGKLSQADYETVDATLRSEALSILDRLTELGEQDAD